jgi:prepilin-type N-terminal cleavage/methylation domain-containing protein
MITCRVRGARRGFTLVEVVVSLVILGGVFLGLALFVSNMAHSSAYSRLEDTAEDLVADRLETVKSATDYASIDSLFARSEGVIPGAEYAGFARQTIVDHVGGQPADSVDYKLVTVIVTNPALPKAVRKTTAIASF